MITPHRVSSPHFSGASIRNQDESDSGQAPWIRRKSFGGLSLPWSSRSKVSELNIDSELGLRSAATQRFVEALKVKSVPVNSRVSPLCGYPIAIPWIPTSPTLIVLPAFSYTESHIMSYARVSTTDDPWPNPWTFQLILLLAIAASTPETTPHCLPFLFREAQ